MNGTQLDTLTLKCYRHACSRRVTVAFGHRDVGRRTVNVAPKKSSYAVH